MSSLILKSKTHCPMKFFLKYFLNLSVISLLSSVNAQNLDYLERNPIYDYSEINLNHTDTVPDFGIAINKLKIMGTVYKNDGTTPAKNILIYIEQADEKGNYAIETYKGKRFMKHRAWVKTDNDGNYTFFTFIPGAAIDPITFPKRRGLKKIYPVVKETNKSEYNLDALLFNDDPKLTKTCRKKLKRKGIDCILTPSKIGNIQVVEKNYILEDVRSVSK